LQRMAESQRDLVEGRRMGAAAAAPTANAARRYLNGEEAPMGGATSGPPTPQTTLPVESRCGLARGAPKRVACPTRRFCAICIVCPVVCASGSTRIGFALSGPML
ncbi:MAG: hypothetical protein EOS08_07860, partial [Mesorhizobium sp.]